MPLNRTKMTFTNTFLVKSFDKFITFVLIYSLIYTKKTYIFNGSLTSFIFWSKKSKWFIVTILFLDTNTKNVNDFTCSSLYTFFHSRREKKMLSIIPFSCKTSALLDLRYKCGYLITSWLTCLIKSSKWLNLLIANRSFKRDFFFPIHWYAHEIF